MSIGYFFDVGNTRGKFWRLDAGRVVARHEAVHHGDMAVLIDGLPADFRAPPTALNGASVLSPKAEGDLVLAASRKWGISPVFARSSLTHSGITNAYRENPARLGVDRWLALIAVQPRRQPICVVDCGTAVTMDVMDAGGIHLGGYILPGLGMMADALLANTQGVRFSSGEAHDDEVSLGVNTATAVTHGALAAVVALVEKLVDGHEATLVLTGGDAARVASALSCPCEVEPELLLHGLQRYFADAGINGPDAPSGA